MMNNYANNTLFLNNQQNQFMSPEVYDACRQVHVNYLDLVQRLQQFGGVPIDRLKASQQTHVANLDMYRAEALRAASNGDIRTASNQLAHIVQEWALFKAYTNLIEMYGMYLDPADPDTKNDFNLSLQHAVAFWATELQNTWVEADLQRKQNLPNIYMERNTQLYGVYHQVTQAQESALNQSHQYNQQYAQAALDGVRQTQQNTQSMMQQMSQNVYWFQLGVQGMFAHGAQVMSEALKTQKEVTKSVEQNLPREMEKAQARVERRKILTRGIVALVLIAAVPLAIGLAWFLLRLVLHF